jgi:hypothetical protein
MGDFDVADRVSVGLHGRSDEMIFEATVRDPSRLVAWSKSGSANSLDRCSFVLILVLSELYGSTVVLRQLMSFQAKRRGRRALEVGALLTRIFCELELMRVWLSSSGFL